VVRESELTNRRELKALKDGEALNKGKLEIAQIPRLCGTNMNSA